MKKNKIKRTRALKLKMFLFKLNYPFIYFVYRPKRFYLTKETKKQFKKTKTPLVYTYNHIGFYDGLALWCTFINRSIRFIAMEEIGVKRIGRFFFDWNGLILINRDIFTLTNYKTIVEAVNSGYSLGIAPEGEINRNIPFKPFKTGTAKFAQYTKTNILPLYFVPHRKIFFKRQHIYIGDIIDIRLFNDTDLLTNKIQQSMEELRYKAFLNNKSYVYTLPIDKNIKEDDVRFKFYEKYNKETASHQYHLSKTAWYYLDLILQTKFGLIIDPKDIKFTEQGKPYHQNIKFNISHSEELVSIVVSAEECSVDIEKETSPKIKKWTKDEAILKHSNGVNERVKTKKIKYNNEKYILSVIAKGKLLFDNKR